LGESGHAAAFAEVWNKGNSEDDFSDKDLENQKRRQIVLTISYLCLSWVRDWNIGCVLIVSCFSCPCVVAPGGLREGDAGSAHFFWRK